MSNPTEKTDSAARRDGEHETMIEGSGLPEREASAPITSGTDVVTTVPAPRAGDTVTLRLRPNNQLVQGRILRLGWWRVLCSWRVRESWDGSPPFRHYEQSGWVRWGRIVGWTPRIGGGENAV